MTHPICKRLLALVLCVAMAAGLLPMVASADEASMGPNAAVSGEVNRSWDDWEGFEARVCENHTAHDAECGYVEGVEGSCAHVCDLCRPSFQLSSEAEAESEPELPVQYSDATTAELSDGAEAPANDGPAEDGAAAADAGLAAGNADIMPAASLLDVCRIGDRYFQSLPEAFDAAKDQDVIVLTRSIETQGPIMVTLKEYKTVTLLLNNQTIFRGGHVSNPTQAATLYLMTSSQSVKGPQGELPRINIRGYGIVGNTADGANPHSIHLRGVDAHLSGVFTKYDGKAPLFGLQVEGGTTVTVENCQIDSKGGAIYTWKGAHVKLISGTFTMDAQYLKHNEGTTEDEIFLFRREWISDESVQLEKGSWVNDENLPLLTNQYQLSELTVYSEDSGYSAFIGNQGYLSLYMAVEAARDGDTIVLRQPAELFQTLEIDKNVTIDLGGSPIWLLNVLGISSSSPMFNIGEGKTVTVQNGSIILYPDQAALTFNAFQCLKNSRLELRDIFLRVDGPDTNKRGVFSGITQRDGSRVGLTRCTLETDDYALIGQGRGVSAQISGDGKYTSRDRDCPFLYSVESGLDIPEYRFPESWKTSKVVYTFAQPMARVPGYGYFQTFEDALNLAVNLPGSTVELLRDYTLNNDGFLFDKIKSLTIDLQGHKLSSSATANSKYEKTPTMEIKNSTVTLKNGTIDWSRQTYIGGSILLVEEGSQVLLQDIKMVTLESSARKIPLKITGQSSVLADGGTYDGAEYAASLSDHSVLLQKAGTFKGGIPGIYEKYSGSQVELYPGSDYVSKSDREEVVQYYAKEDSLFYIGEMKDRRFYSALSGAVTAAKNGETIHLFKNVELSSGVRLRGGKRFTLSLDGHTLSINSDFPLFIIEDGEVTLSSGLKGGGRLVQSGGKPAVQVAATEGKTAAFRVLSGEVVTEGTDVAVALANADSSLYLDGECVFRSDGPAAITSDSGSVVFSENVMAQGGSWQNKSLVQVVPALFLIGETKYESLKTAEAAVREGETIVLRKSITVSEPQQMQSAYAHTLDLAGNTIVMDTAEKGFELTLAALGPKGKARETVTLKNGTIINNVSTEDRDYPSCAIYAQGANLLVQDVKVESKGAGLAAYEDSQVLVDGCKMTSKGNNVIIATDTANVQILSANLVGRSGSLDTILATFGGKAKIYPIRAFEATPSAWLNAEESLQITQVENPVQLIQGEESTAYPTLEAALEAAPEQIEEGQPSYILQLLHDYTATAPLSLPLGINKLDLNGHTLDFWSDMEAFLLPGDGEPELRLSGGAVINRGPGTAILLGNRHLRLHDVYVEGQETAVRASSQNSYLYVEWGGITEFLARGGRSCLGMTVADTGKNFDYYQGANFSPKNDWQNASHIKISANEYYSLTLKETTGGSATVKVSPFPEAAAGDKVTVSVSVSEENWGLVVGNPQILTEEGKPVECSATGDDGVYTFIMPESNVTIQAALMHPTISISLKYDTGNVYEYNLLIGITPPQRDVDVYVYSYPQDRREDMLKATAHGNPEEIEGALGSDWCEQVAHIVANGSQTSYCPTYADVGKYLYVKAVNSDGSSWSHAGIDEVVKSVSSSPATVESAKFNQRNAQVGERLSVSVEGPAPAKYYAYHWFIADSKEDPGKEIPYVSPDIAYSPSVYTPTADDIGKFIYVVVEGENGSSATTERIGPVLPGVCRVTLPTGEHFTAKAENGSASPVIMGNKYQFSVTLNEGYQAGPDFAVKANGVPLTPTPTEAADGKENRIYHYTIEKIWEDQAVTVEGVVFEPYTATLPSGTGYRAEAIGWESTPEGYNFQFRVVIEKGYHAGANFSVDSDVRSASVLSQSESAGETVLEYVVDDVDRNLKITVVGVEKDGDKDTDTFQVILPEGIGYTISYNTISSYVKKGASFMFRVVIDTSRYRAGLNYAVKVNDKLLYPKNVSIINGVPSEYIYVLSDITADQQVKVDGVESKFTVPQATYTVEIARDGTGYRLETEKGSISRVLEGGSYHFAVTIKKGYHAGGGFAVKASGASGTQTLSPTSQEQSGEDFVQHYTVTDIREDLQITVEGVEPDGDNARYVTLKSGEGYTLAAAAGYQSPVTAGDAFRFTVTIEEGYHTTPNFAVKSNDSVLTPQENVYTIENIQEDQIVTVEGVEADVPPDAYRVILTPGDGYTLEAVDGSSSPVVSGGSFQFRLTLLDSYRIGTDFAVKSNDNVLTLKEGVYTIENIGEDQIVTVEGVELDVPDIVQRYDITLTEGEGYTLALAQGSQTTVAAGDSCQVSVTIADGYQAGSGFAVKANGNRLTETESGVYTISNVRENQTVTVEGVEPATTPPDSYLVSLVQGRGFTLAMALGSQMTVSAGGSCQIAVTILDGYQAGTDFAVKANGSPLNEAEPGVYTIENITENQRVTVEGVEQVAAPPQTRHDILLMSGTGYVLEAMPNFDNPVVSGEPFQFTVKIQSGYRAGANFKVKAGNETLTETSPSVYTIERVTQTLLVTVEGVEYIGLPTPGQHTVTVHGSSGVPSGAGSYGLGETVTIRAGSRSGYTFSGWSVTPATVNLANANSAVTTFQMPDTDVTVTANWRSTGGGWTSSGSSNNSVCSETTAIIPEPITEGVIRPSILVNKSDEATVDVPDGEIQSAVERALSEARQKGRDANQIAVSVDMLVLTSGFRTLSVVLPRAALEALINAKVVYLSLCTPQISLSLDLEAIKTIYASTGGDVTFRMARMEDAALPLALAGRPAYRLSVESGTTTVTDFGKGYVAITLPYAVSESELGGSLQMAYVDGKGKAQLLSDSSYIADWTAMLGRTNHFSVFGIVDRKEKAPANLQDHWAKDDIQFAMTRSLFDGISGEAVQPDGKMTRAMLAMALYRLAGSPQISGDGLAFVDVPADSSYAAAARWAADLGLISGTADTAFSPEQEVSRQELAVILLNFARLRNDALPITRLAVNFTDVDSITCSASEAVRLLQQAGVLMGKTGNRFDPTGAVTCAEAAAVFRRYMELQIDRKTAQGWDKNDSGEWMYYEDGRPATGIRTIGGATYRFHETGIFAETIFVESKKPRHYVVRKNDTLWKIAQDHRCTVEEIMKLNQNLIKNPNLILIGWELMIPSE